MPETIQAIQTKHQDAVAEITNRLENIYPEDDRFAIGDALVNLSEAFAAALTHHADYLTRLTAATKIAIEIERAT